MVNDLNDHVHDPESGLLSEAYFRVAIAQRLAVARRVLRPLAVAVIAAESEPRAMAPTLLATLRDSDTVCRLDDGDYALILEDTPEEGAVWAVQRIRQALADAHPGHTIWAGVACYPAHAFDADELLFRAAEALSAAREWPQHRTEVAPLKP